MLSFGSRLVSIYFPLFINLSIHLSCLSTNPSIISQEVQGTLDDRIDVLEDFFDNQLSRKIDNIEYALERSVTNRFHDVEGTYMSRAQSIHEELKIEEKKGRPAWMIPFMILVVLMIGGAIGLYLFYEKMRKMHLL